MYSISFLFRILLYLGFTFILLNCNPSNHENIDHVGGNCVIIDKLIIPYSSVEVLSFLPWDFKGSITPPIIIGGFDSLLSLITYPEIAKRSNIKGSVLFEFNINSEGKAKDIKLIKGIGAGCEDVVVDAIKKLKYIPASKDGNFVNQIMRLSIKFNLWYNKP